MVVILLAIQEGHQDDGIMLFILEGERGMDRSAYTDK